MDTGFDFSDLVEEAVQRSGGEAATAQDVLNVRRGLRILTERWMAQGFNTWRITVRTVGVSGASPVIKLPACVDDVYQVSYVRSSNNESAMQRISASQYAQLTNKLTRGQPSQWWLNRQEQPELNIFPMGRQDVTDTLTVYCVDRPEAFSAYDPVDDVPGRWLEALVLGLALDLARKRPPFNEGLIGRLKAEALEAEDLAQRADRDRANYRVRI